jgi:hypothetical protein
VAKPSIPFALEMRRLKYSEGVPAEEKDEMAARLRKEGRRTEAILLFDGRTDHPFVRQEIDWAVSEGVAFHLVALRKMGAAVTAKDCEACARAAEKRERWMDARTCWKELGDGAALERIAPNLPECLRPPPPPPAETIGTR